MALTFFAIHSIATTGVAHARGYSQSVPENITAEIVGAVEASNEIANSGSHGNRDWGKLHGNAACAMDCMAAVQPHIIVLENVGQKLMPMAGPAPDSSESFSTFRPPIA